MNFYNLSLTWHKGFPEAISRFFGHPQDTFSYPLRLPAFPPCYPQIRPQSVEFAFAVPGEPGHGRVTSRPSAGVVRPAPESSGPRAGFRADADIVRARAGVG